MKNVLLCKHAFSFTCGSKLRLEWEEWLFVQSPMLVHALLCLMLSVALMLLARDMRTHFLRCFCDITPSLADANLARTTIRFALCISFLVELNAVATFLWLTQALKFGEDLSIWSGCMSSGINPWKETDGPHGFINATNLSPSERLEHCGDVGSLAPAIEQLLLLTLSQSLPSVLFGFLFAVHACRFMRFLHRRRRKIVGQSSLWLARTQKPRNLSKSHD